MNQPATDGHDRDDRARLERVDHERVDEQLVHVGQRIEREVRVHARLSGRGGRSGGRAPRAGRRRRAARPRRRSTSTGTP